MLGALVHALMNESRDAVECCEFCDLPLLDERVYADPETCEGGLGIALCTRRACIREREAMSFRERLNVYLAHAAW